MIKKILLTTLIVLVSFAVGAIASFFITMHLCSILDERMRTKTEWYELYEICDAINLLDQDKQPEARAIMEEKLFWYLRRTAKEGKDARYFGIVKLNLVRAIGDIYAKRDQEKYDKIFSAEDTEKMEALINSLPPP